MLSKLLGGDLVKNVGGIIDSLHTSEEEKAQAKIKLKEIEAQINKAQSDINLADAKSVAGGLSGMLQRSWRPLIGMSCALAIFWEYVLKQFLMFAIATFNLETAPLPQLDMSTLMPLVMALLGMGALRTYEKKTGVSK
jgi:hypothetical protein|tara:strand:+ start:498 stop:911 length:414 start_codon:yes stop_codon:yes gene_type:complete